MRHASTCGRLNGMGSCALGVVKSGDDMERCISHHLSCIPIYMYIDRCTYELVLIN